MHHTGSRTRPYFAVKRTRIGAYEQPYVKCFTRFRLGRLQFFSFKPHVCRCNTKASPKGKNSAQVSQQAGFPFSYFRAILLRFEPAGGILPAAKLCSCQILNQGTGVAKGNTPGPGDPWLKGSRESFGERDEICGCLSG